MAISNYYLVPPLPEGLEGLAEMALDLRWSWSHATDRLWERLDPKLWNLTRNPWLILQMMSTARLVELANDPEFVADMNAQLAEHRDRVEQTTWYQRVYGAARLTVAYFSMEFGLTEALRLYSGGLGVLAGDHLKTATDLGVPIVGIGLLYEQGYFRQTIDTLGSQIEFYPFNDPSQMPILPLRDADGEWLRVEVPFPGRPVSVRVWEARIGLRRLYLLDCNDPLNSAADRCITTELYGGGPELRLQQEMILGIGGWRLMRALKLPINVCHLNEGHAALAALERAGGVAEEHSQTFEVALAATRPGNIFTSHTPVAAGFDRFSPELAEQYLSPCAARWAVAIGDLLALGRENPRDDSEPFNMAWLAVRTAGRINGVSRLHGQVTRHLFQRLFPRWPEREVPVAHVTNGIHMPTWDSAEADDFWQRITGKERWRGTMETISVDILRAPDELLWDLRMKSGRALVEYARTRLARQLASAGASEAEIAEAGRALENSALTLGFARRFTEYKRPTLLLRDRERLARLLNHADRPVQIVVAGKAHPRDAEGKRLIREWFQFSRRPDIRRRVVFLTDYDLLLAEHLVQGVDLWINTPRRPWEASGTSGMKVLANGGLNLSELDGWWAEAYRPQVGWAIGDRQEHDSDPDWDVREADQLYELLEKEVVPAFYDRDARGIPLSWVARMRASMAELAPQFSSNRMLREYLERLYLPAAREAHERTAAGCRQAARIVRWRQTLSEAWDELRFGRLEIDSRDGLATFRVSVELGRLDHELIQVQLYAEPRDEGPAEVHLMKREGELYSVTIPSNRSPGDYTPRIVAHLEGARVPLEAQQIHWYR